MPTINVMPSLPSTEAEIDAFLAAFQTCTLPKARWTHSAHIFTGACLVYSLGAEAAIVNLRPAIRRYNVAVGGQNTPTGGYHETVTLFWIKLLARFYRETVDPAAPLSRAEFAALAVEHFARQRDLLGRFYDFDVVGSIEARLVWVPPTLEPLD